VTRIVCAPTPSSAARYLDEYSRRIAVRVGDEKTEGILVVLFQGLIQPGGKFLDRTFARFLAREYENADKQNIR
jgi:hypothetical protein